MEGLLEVSRVGNASLLGS